MYLSTRLLTLTSKFFITLSKYFLNYEEYFASYMTVNRLFGEEIYKIMGENDLIMINDVHLMLIPNNLLIKNNNAKIGIYFHSAFPSSDVIKTFPFHQELIKSVLLCDVIGFHVFQYARNFLTACKRLYGIFYEIKIGGFITLNYLGRHILIRIMHAGIDMDYIKSIISKKEFPMHVKNFKSLIGDKFSLVSVDLPNDRSGLLLKLESYRRFLEKFTTARENLILIQIIKSDDIDQISEAYMEMVENMIQSINTLYPNSVKLIKCKKFSVSERFSLFSLGACLFYLNIREGNCMYANEYIALQHLFKSDRDKLNFGIILSENVGVSSAIKGPFRVNPFNLNSLVTALEKVYHMREEEKMIKFKNDLEHVLQSTTFSWIKNFFIDLKRTSTVS
jgi:trehalose 6-phosphate synthase/phosphatase